METMSTETKQAVEQTEALAKKYQGFSIVSAESYQFASEDLRKIKSKAKEIDALRKSLTAPLDESKKKIMAMFKPPFVLLGMAETQVKSAMIGWQQEQERIRIAEQRRLAEIQHKEAERLRAAEAEEAKRIATLESGEEKAKAAERAANLAELAESVESAPLPVVAPVIAEAQGISTRKVWRFEVIDISKLSREYMIADEKMIGAMVRATKGQKPITGIRIYSEDVIAAR